MKEQTEIPEDRAGDGIRPWTTLDVELVADCRIFAVKRIRRESPDGGKRGEFCTIDSPDWVNVIALTDEGEVVMIRQYRHGSDEITLEIPGGILDEGEKPEDAARRELLEETGFAGDRGRIIGCVRPNPALFDNSAYTVLITGARRVAEPSPDEHEDIAVRLYSLKEAEEMLRRGEITHSLVVNAFLWLRLYGTEEGPTG